MHLGPVEAVFIDHHGRSPGCEHFLVAKSDESPAKKVDERSGEALEKIRFGTKDCSRIVMLPRVATGCLNKGSIADMLALKGHYWPVTQKRLFTDRLQ